MSEPLATLTLAGTVLSFMWASDKGRKWWAWAIPGVLLGLTAFARPEYLAFVVVFALLALWRGGLMAAAGARGRVRRCRSRRGRSHVSSVEGRFVPISTGGGKAIFIGTYLPGNGLHLDVKRELLRRSARPDEHLARAS